MNFNPPWVQSSQRNVQRDQGERQRAEKSRGERKAPITSSINNEWARPQRRKSDASSLSREHKLRFHYAREHVQTLFVSIYSRSYVIARGWRRVSHVTLAASPGWDCLIVKSSVRKTRLWRRTCTEETNEKWFCPPSSRCSHEEREAVGPRPRIHRGGWKGNPIASELNNLSTDVVEREGTFGNNFLLSGNYCGSAWDR